MNIIMMTNTYVPMVGGVARSVESYTRALRARGHYVVVVAPEFEGMPEHEEDVIRVPAIQRFNGSDFSVRLPIPALVSVRLKDYDPDLIHAHHPFLMGDTALRAAAARGVPLAFTHHTMYERYTHYVPGDSPVMQRFAIDMATEYANLCDQVIAPSASIADILKERGVTTPIAALPTGIDPDRFAKGDGRAFRRQHGIPDDATVVGHVGRLAEEKNLALLARAVARGVALNPSWHFLVVGDGPAAADIRAIFTERDLVGRLHLVGSRDGSALADAYHAMDAFAFASQSETQGMVLAEAMTAGVPVVAVDAPGAREVVRDGENGRLLEGEDAERFAEALREVAGLTGKRRRAMQRAARQTAESFALQRCTDRLESIYREVVTRDIMLRPIDGGPWDAALKRIEAEWDLWTTRLAAAARTANADEAAAPAQTRDGS